MAASVFFITCCEDDFYTDVEAYTRGYNNGIIIKRIKLDEIKDSKKIERCVDLLNKDADLDKVDTVHIVALDDGLTDNKDAMLRSITELISAINQYRYIASESIYCHFDISRIRFQNGREENAFKTLEAYKLFFSSDKGNLRLYFVDSNVNDKWYYNAKKSIAMNIIAVYNRGHQDQLPGDGFRWSTLQYMSFDVLKYLKTYLKYKRIAEEDTDKRPADIEKEIERLIEGNRKLREFDYALEDLTMLPVIGNVFYNGKRIKPHRIIKRALNGKTYQEILKQLYGQELNGLEAALKLKANATENDAEDKKELIETASKMAALGGLPFVEGGLETEGSLLYQLDAQRRKYFEKPSAKFEYTKGKPAAVIRKVLQTGVQERYVSLRIQERIRFIDNLINEVESMKAGYIKRLQKEEKKLMSELNDLSFNSFCGEQDFTEATDNAMQALKNDAANLEAETSIYVAAQYAPLFFQWFLGKSEPNKFIKRMITYVNGFSVGSERLIYCSPGTMRCDVNGANVKVEKYNGEACTFESLVIFEFNETQGKMLLYGKLGGENNAV